MFLGFFLHRANVFVLFRKVQTESATGSTSSNKIRTTLTITVEAIDFDTQACMLRVKGRNIEENQYVKVTLTLVHLIALTKCRFQYESQIGFLWYFCKLHA